MTDIDVRPAWLDRVLDRDTAERAIRHHLRTCRDATRERQAELVVEFTRLQDALAAAAGTHHRDPLALSEAFVEIVAGCGASGAALAPDIRVAVASRRTEQPDRVDLLWQDLGNPLGARWPSIFAHLVTEDSSSALHDSGGERQVASAPEPERPVAFGTWTVTIDRLLALSDPRSQVHAPGPGSSGAWRVVDHRGDLTALVMPSDPRGVEAETASTIKVLLRDQMGVAAVRLVRYVVNRVQRQHARQAGGSGWHGDPRDVLVDGGWQELARRLGGVNRVRLRDSAALLERVHLRTRRPDSGPLLTIGVSRKNGRQHLRLSAGLVLSPDFRRCGGVLVPVPDPTKLLPLLGRGATHAAQLRLQQLWLLLLRHEWSQLMERRGVVVPRPAAVWTTLAERAGLPHVSLDKVLCLWREGRLDVPPFLQVAGDIWTLAEAWEPEMRLLLEGARRSQQASNRARRATGTQNRAR
jgi:hypothetical protein